MKPYEVMWLIGVIVMAIGGCAIDSESVVPLIIFAAGAVVTFSGFGVREYDRRSRRSHEK